MKVSEHWLREWVKFDLDTEGLVRCLTMAGLEVESYDAAGTTLNKVVNGRIVDATRHPDADRLRVCQVDIGRRNRLQIVCAAPNARPGLNAPVALVGAELPIGTVIEQTRIRGVESEGMLCSAPELLLGDDSSGLLELGDDAVPGHALSAYLQLDDVVIDIELTPNRGDCLSVLGIARELVVLANGRMRRRHLTGWHDEGRARIDIALRDPAACPRYIGRVIEDIDVNCPTPIHLRERLRRCGIRPISAVVDVTNYVMLELGQPMHAFDRDRLTAGIVVRRAHDAETLTVLDGSELVLDPSALVIADHANAVAVAGVMGGMDSAISEQTRHIVLEAAHFTPGAVAGRARRHGLHSDSAHRFERGVDPNLPYIACHYATTLLKGFAGGRPGRVCERVARRHLPRRSEVYVRHQRVNRLLGISLGRKEIRSTLSRVAPSGVRADAGGWRVSPPSYRFDIARECDLIEEIVRVRGYDSLPAAMPSIRVAATVPRETSLHVDRIKEVLANRDFCEAITYSFVDPAVQHRLQVEHASEIALQNPLASSLSAMRTTLWAGLLGALSANINRQQRRVRLFEIGKTFHRDHDSVREVERVAVVACGDVSVEQWGEPPRALDFFDLKSDLEAILGLTRDTTRFSLEKSSHPALHPGQAAVIRNGSHVVGRIGRLHPRVQQHLDLNQTVFLFEIQINALDSRTLPAYRQVSRYPAIRRDMSIVVDRAVPAAQVMEVARAAAGEHLTNLELFDVYQREGIDSKRKSLTFSLTLQASSRTLIDSEVEAVEDQVLGALRHRFNADLRTK